MFPDSLSEAAGTAGGNYNLRKLSKQGPALKEASRRVQKSLARVSGVQYTLFFTLKKGKLKKKGARSSIG